MLAAAPITRQEAASELLRRRNARRSVLSFAQYTHHKFVVGWHHRQICNALEAVERGEIDRLMIFAPPRHSKSELVSVRFPAWYLGRNQHKQIMAVSYSDELASDFGRKVRNLVAEDAYRRVFPGVDLREDSRAAGRWHTTSGGTYVSLGIGGSATGRGSDCLARGEKVLTWRGWVPIENVGVGDLVLTHRARWRKVLATTSMGARPVIRLTGRGASVTCTNDHRVLTPGGWRAAEESKIILGLEMQAMRPAIHPKGAMEGPEVLWACLLARVGKRAGCAAPQAVQELRDPNHPGQQDVLLSTVLWSIRALVTRAADSLRKAMRAVRQGVYAEQQERYALLCAVQGQDTFSRDAGRKQFKLPAWRRFGAQDTLFSRGGRAACVGANEALPGVRDEVWTHCASYQREPNGQPAAESGCGLPWVPHVVSQVEELGFAEVFDLQVEEDSSFIAGGFVVHNCLIIDDPFKSREEADSERIRDKVWNTYESDLQSRLMPGGAIVLMHCMTGDTPVLLASGLEKPLRDIRPGDAIATYDNGEIKTSTVRNWANQGPDRVFAIRMKSGITVKANARHPFLVVDGDKAEWRRTDSLRRGDVIPRATGASGGTSNVLWRGVTSHVNAKACACHTTTRADGRTVFGRLRSILAPVARRICDTATGLISQSMSACWPRKAGFAQYASSRPRAATRAPTGMGSSVLTTATEAERFEGFSAMTAILRSAMGKRRKFSAQPLSTFKVIHDTVADVIECGVEDVFDIQVDRTENFIANGLVSHNTRWHEDDLAGRLLDAQRNGGDKWEVLELPAILGENTDKECALWPEWYSLEAMQRRRTNTEPRTWSALYQQRPQTEEGTFFKREWFQRFRFGEEPRSLNRYITSDFAVTDGAGDYTEHAVWGVDSQDNLWALDWWSGQTAADEWIERLLDLVVKHKPLGWFGEAGVIHKAIEPMLVRRMRERKAYFRLERDSWLPSIHDKPTRARGFQARASMRKVYVPQIGWGDRLIDQLLRFPAGKHDDAVDACSLMGMALDQAHKAIVRPQDKPKPKDAWDEVYKNQLRSDEESWRTK